MSAAGEPTCAKGRTLLGTRLTAMITLRASDMTRYQAFTGNAALYNEA